MNKKSYLEEGVFMKKLLKSFISIITIILVLSFGTQTAFAGEFKQSTLEGVVLIVSTLENGKSPYGTGFFVGKEGEDPQYILTNCHVIQKFLDEGGSAGTALLQVAYDKTTLEEGYVVTYDAEKDIAIIKLAKPTDKRSSLKLKAVDKSSVGSSVFAVGYPGLADETVKPVDYFGKNDATVTGGRIGRLITESKTGRALLQMDVSINHGSSGGPLVDESGNVVGINTQGSALDPNLNYAVSIEEAIPLLKNNNIPYEMGKVSNAKQYIIPIIGASAALLVIIVALIFVLLKGKKKKVTKSAKVAIPPTIPPVQEKKLLPVIHSMSKQNLGLTSAVTAQPIIIGRDSNVCRLVFKDDTPGVSSKHCQIYFDENSKSFILTDLKSTYGTYLSNGQKLTPNIPYSLRPKDSFYLGEKDNLIYIDLE